jgi:hypothetical protein
VWRIEAGFPEARAHVLTHFIAAGADGRADRDQQIRRLATELFGQSFDRHDGNRQGQTAPTRMNRRDNAGPPIDDEKWQTVGGLNRESQSAGVGQNDVRLSV